MMSMFYKKTNGVIALLLLWQVISVYLMAVGVWPREVVWINFGLIALFMLLATPYDALRLFIVSIPFYVVLPNAYADSLSMWRPLLVLLFSIVVVKNLFESWKAKSLGFYKQLSTYRLQPWDYWILLFGGIILLSTLIAKYPAESITQLLFLVNAFFVYIIVRTVVSTAEQIRGLILGTVISLGFIVFVGYIQLVGTFFAEQYYFWQYWATWVSSLYYGQSLSNVLAYSNSWFSYTGGTPSLRMFSIMPDSHSFAMVAAFLIAFLLPFTIPKNSEGKTSPKKIKLAAWSAIRFSGLAVVLAGTRGVWVGMLAPLFLSVALYVKNVGRPILKKAIISFVMIVLLFVVSPFINQGLNYVRMGGHGTEDLLNRAASIYDLQEQSNVGRLEMWKESSLYALTHPFGVGYGNFVVSLVHDIPEGTTFDEVGNIKNQRYNLPQKFVTAHSLYLNILVELGLVGLVAFLGIALSFLWKSWKYFMRHRAEENELTFFVVTASLLAVWFLAYGVFDVTLFNDKILIYTFITLGLSSVIMTKPSPE